MSNPIDLHTHTHYSDGRYTPAKVLHQAARMGIKTLAITDHDNANGTREALPLAQKLGIELIPAVEFTCRWPECNTLPGNGDIDVLAYFVDLDDADFQAFEQAILDDIHARVAECCSLLSMDGYDIFMEDVFAQNPRYGGVLQLVLAIQDKGYIADWDEAAGFAAGYWKRVRLNRFTIQDVIAHIHRAGGVAVLAHPSVITCDDAWISAEHMAFLVEAGLDGLEIYHDALDEAARAYFLKFVEQFELLVTGGSDLHGWFSDFEGFGTHPVTADMVDALRARHLTYKGS